MVRVHTRRWWLLLATLGVPATLLVAGVLTLVRHGTVLVHQCVPVNAVNGWLGIQFALLRPDSECPSGALALGGDARQAVGVMVVVALPVLTAHLVGAGGLLGLAGVLRHVIAVAVALLRHIAPTLPVPREVMVSWRAEPVASAHHAPLDRLVASCLWRRGPPVSFAA